MTGARGAVEGAPIPIERRGPIVRLCLVAVFQPKLPDLQISHNCSGSTSSCKQEGEEAFRNGRFGCSRRRTSDKDSAMTGARSRSDEEQRMGRRGGAFDPLRQADGKVTVGTAYCKVNGPIDGRAG